MLALKGGMAVAILLLSATSGSAADLAIPKPCTCKNWSGTVSAGVSFEQELPEEGSPGGGGVCRYTAYYIEEQDCPSEGRCIPEMRIAGISVMSQVPVYRRADCKPELFPPFQLPFISGHDIGPFRSGYVIDTHVAWFTQNFDQAQGTGPLRAEVSRFGVRLQGVIPEDATSNIPGSITVSNRWGRRTLRYTIRIAN